MSEGTTKDWSEIPVKQDNANEEQTPIPQMIDPEQSDATANGALVCECGERLDEHNKFKPHSCLQCDCKRFMWNRAQPG